jgi:hypothetical protein
MPLFHQTPAIPLTTLNASETLICAQSWLKPPKVLMMLNIPAQAPSAGLPNGMPNLTGTIDISSQAQSWLTSLQSASVTLSIKTPVPNNVVPVIVTTLPAGVPASAVIQPNTTWSRVIRPSMTGAPVGTNLTKLVPNPVLPACLSFSNATLTPGPYVTYMNVLIPAGSVPGYGALSAHIPLTMTTRQYWCASLRTALLNAAGKSIPIGVGIMTTNSAN